MDTETCSLRRGNEPAGRERHRHAAISQGTGGRLGNYYEAASPSSLRRKARCAHWQAAMRPGSPARATRTRKAETVRHLKTLLVSRLRFTAACEAWRGKGRKSASPWPRGCDANAEESQGALACANGGESAAHVALAASTRRLRLAVAPTVASSAHPESAFDAPRGSSPRSSRLEA